MLTYAHPDVFPAVTAATAKFSAEVTDPKASMLSTVTFYQGMVSLPTTCLNDTRS